MSTNMSAGSKRSADSNITPRSGSGGPAAAKKSRTTAKSLAIFQDEFNRIKAAPIKKDLNAIVKKLARQVNADWHNGWEEQAQTKLDWFHAIQEPLQAVLDIGVAKGKALLQCNEVLKIVADSLSDLLACPCRCDTLDEFSDMDPEFSLKLPWGGTFSTGGLDFNCPRDTWSYVWVALLRTHASKENFDEDLILRCIKDASDNMQNAKLMELPGFLYDENDDDFDCDKTVLKDGKDAPSGAALARLIDKKKWETLATTKKGHRMRRGIDRRFDM